MRSATHVGRVGALAFALGVGWGLATTPWVASAETSETGSSSVSAPSPSTERSKSDPSTEDEGTAKTDTADDSSDGEPESAEDEPDPGEDEDAEEVSAAPGTGSTDIDDEAENEGSPTDSVPNQDSDVLPEGEEEVDGPGPESTARLASTTPSTITVSESTGDTAPEALEPTAVVSDVALTVPGTPSAPTGGDPALPLESQALLAQAAFARRDADQPLTQPSAVDLPTADVAAGLVETQAFASQAVSLEPPAGPSWDPALFTGKPSFLSKVFSTVFGLVSAVGNFLGVDLSIPLVKLLSSSKPPWLTTLGLKVTRDEFEGMAVWSLRTAGSTSEKTVVGVHGGALLAHPALFNWLDYATIARKTGATVVVPIYPLAGKGGTARSVTTAIADLIADQVDRRGAQNVGVLGDSAGGNIALASAQEMVRRGDTVPAHMVLSSPGLDSTLSNPDIAFVDDPVLSDIVVPTLLATSEIWADGLELTDPLVSPLFGSLAGLPKTTVYAGSRDIVMPDVLRLREKALATPGADFTFVLRNGQMHDWAIVTFLPETAAILPDMYRQLGALP